MAPSLPRSFFLISRGGSPLAWRSMTIADKSSMKRIFSRMASLPCSTGPSRLQNRGAEIKLGERPERVHDQVVILVRAEVLEPPAAEQVAGEEPALPGLVQARMVRRVPGRGQRPERVRAGCRFRRERLPVRGSGQAPTQRAGRGGASGGAGSSNTAGRRQVRISSRRARREARCSRCGPRAGAC